MTVTLTLPDPHRKYGEPYVVPPEILSRTLNDAADVIERDGWWQEQNAPSPNPNAPVCSVGAINRAVTGSAFADGANLVQVHRIRATATWLAITLGLPSPTAVVGWNDRSDRTQQQVLDAFRHAAKEVLT